MPPLVTGTGTRCGHTQLQAPHAVSAEAGQSFMINPQANPLFHAVASPFHSFLTTRTAALLPQTSSIIPTARSLRGSSRIPLIGTILRSRGPTCTVYNIATERHRLHGPTLPLRGIHSSMCMYV